MYFYTNQLTDPGGRSPNEDSVGYFTDGTISAWIAADGLGGHISGEIASAKAVSTLKEVMSECKYLNEEFVENAFRKMNEAVLSLSGPLTTAVCAFSDGKKLWYANNGDSRFFFIRNKKVLYHTNDHSIAFIAYKTGNISYDDIPTHPGQNRLYHSLGNESAFYGEFYQEIDLKAGDAFLLATDGFWELIRDEEIVRTLNISNSSQDWMDTMLDIIKTRLRKTSDNYSAVCVTVKD